jgi:hypothetical protein
LKAIAHDRNTAQKHVARAKVILATGTATEEPREFRASLLLTLPSLEPTRS